MVNVMNNEFSLTTTQLASKAIPLFDLFLERKQGCAVNVVGCNCGTTIDITGSFIRAVEVSKTQMLTLWRAISEGLFRNFSPLFVLGNLTSQLDKRFMTPSAVEFDLRSFVTRASDGKTLLTTIVMFLSKLIAPYLIWFSTRGADDRHLAAVRNESLASSLPAFVEVAHGADRRTVKFLGGFGQFLLTILAGSHLVLGKNLEMQTISRQSPSGASPQRLDVRHRKVKV